MATEDTRSQFERIVEQLTTDYPSLRRAPRAWPRPVLVMVMAVGGVVWGLLSIAMVAWGARGVVLTCTVVALTAVALAVDDYRRRR